MIKKKKKKEKQNFFSIQLEQKFCISIAWHIWMNGFCAWMKWEKNENENKRKKEEIFKPRHLSSLMKSPLTQENVIFVFFSDVIVYFRHSIFFSSAFHSFYFQPLALIKQIFDYKSKLAQLNIVIFLYVGKNQFVSNWYIQQNRSMIRFSLNFIIKIREVFCIYILFRLDNCLFLCKIYHLLCLCFIHSFIYLNFFFFFEWVC